MAQVMESWFLADREALKAFSGDRFNENRLPARERPIEDVPKAEVFRALRNATANLTTSYDKGEHSFKLLAKIDHAKVTRASRWAYRFIDEIKKKMARSRTIR